METIVAELKDNSLVITSEVGKRLGWKKWTKLHIEADDSHLYLHPQDLSAEEIARVARIYLAEYVGNATDVKTPVRDNGKWRVEAVLSHRPQTIGYMTFTVQGELVEEESDSPAKLQGLQDED